MTTDPADQDDRPSLELRKLSAENEKLKREIARLDQVAPEAARSYQLEHRKTTFAAVTTIVALVGFFYTATSQQCANQRSQEDRRDDEFADAVKELGSAKEELGRISAVNAIAVFSADPKYEARARSLLIQALPFVREQRTRAAITDALVRPASTAALTDLIEFNKALQQQLELRISQQISDARQKALLQDEYDEELEGEPDPRVLAWPNVWSETDKLQELVDDLGWSAETLLALMNKQRKIEGLDMSGVVLARLEPLKVAKSDDNVTYSADPVRCRSIGTPVEGLSLVKVNLSNSVLACLEFTNATFDQVMMDKATLYKSTFTGSSFRKVSLQSFRTWASYVAQEDGGTLIKRSYVVGPEWKNCRELVLSRFEARVPSHKQKVPQGPYFTFDQCSWSIETPGGLVRPPRNGRQQTFYGMAAP